MPFDADHLSQSDSERHETARLGEVWNAHLAGDAFALDSLDPVDAATIQTLLRISPVPIPDSPYVRDLKTKLINTSPDLNVRDVRRYHFSPIETPSIGRQQLPSTAWDRLRSNIARWRSLAALFAMILVTALAGFYVISSPSADRNTGSPEDASHGDTALTIAVPDGCLTYGVDCSAVRSVGHVFINLANYSSADLKAQKVQFQVWNLEPGANTERATTEDLHGSVLEFVLAGTASMIIDATAEVLRDENAMSSSQFETVPAGEPLELGQGDTVSYPLGSSRVLVNPLSATTLRLVSVVIYDGDVALSRPQNPQSAEVQVLALADGALPNSLGDYTVPIVAADLDFIWVYEEYPLPDTRYGLSRILGPISGLAAVSPDGYVLWVGESQR